ncbi:MAG: hypothetical protein IT292_04090 [Deltaproteobacteria bacterium]|nr:hypothetical protein [Deltaproteobacteria bacterium]
MSKPEITDVLTAGFGATGGGQCRIHRWDLQAQEVSEIKKGSIEWSMINGLKMWNIEWLENFANILVALLKPGYALKLYG